MKFLDTSFLIDILRKHPSAELLLKQIIQDEPHVTNTIVMRELLVGAYGSSKPKAELKARNDLLKKILILSFDTKSAEQSAIIENRLRKSGKYIGGADILIAGTMIAYNISTIVTKNVKHFNRIPNITVETY